MQQAIVLMHIARGQLDRVAQQLLAIDGITEVYSTAGQYDMVALLKVDNGEELNRVVNADMARVEGIERTHTLTAFRCYDREDLSRMFSVGLDQ